MRRQILPRTELLSRPWRRHFDCRPASWAAQQASHKRPSSEFHKRTPPLARTQTPLKGHKRPASWAHKRALRAARTPQDFSGCRRRAYAGSCRQNIFQRFRGDHEGRFRTWAVAQGVARMCYTERRPASRGARPATASPVCPAERGPVMRLLAKGLCQVTLEEFYLTKKYKSGVGVSA